MIIAWAGVGVAAGLAFGTPHILRVQQLPQRANHHRGASPLRIRADLRCLEAGKRKISETKRIRIDAGSNMTRAESMFAGSAHPRFEIGIGLAQRPGNGGIAKNQEEGWMSYWQPADRDRGNIGCAIVLPDKIPDKIEEFATESARCPS